MWCWRMRNHGRGNTWLYPDQWHVMDLPFLWLVLLKELASGSIPNQVVILEIFSLLPYISSTPCLNDFPIDQLIMSSYHFTISNYHSFIHDHPHLVVEAVWQDTIHDPTTQAAIFEEWVVSSCPSTRPVVGQPLIMRGSLGSTQVSTGLIVQSVSEWEWYWVVISSDHVWVPSLWVQVWVPFNWVTLPFHLQLWHSIHHPFLLSFYPPFSSMTFPSPILMSFNLADHKIGMLPKAHVHPDSGWSFNHDLPRPKSGWSYCPDCPIPYLNPSINSDQSTLVGSFKGQPPDPTLPAESIDLPSVDDEGMASIEAWGNYDVGMVLDGVSYALVSWVF